MTLSRYANHRFHPFRCLAKSENHKSPSCAVSFCFFLFFFFFCTSSSNQNIPQNTPVENPPLVSLCFSSDVMDVPRIHTSSLMELAYINLKYTCRTITSPTVTQKIICAYRVFMFRTVLILSSDYFHQQVFVVQDLSACGVTTQC